jgi:hypothetical protein
LAYLNYPRDRRREDTDGITGKTGKYPVWEYCFYYSYSDETQDKNRNFEVRIRVATPDRNPKSKERLMYYIANLLMERLEIDITGPDWATKSVGIRQVGWANSQAMIYRIFSKDRSRPGVWPKYSWGRVPKPD